MLVVPGLHGLDLRGVLLQPGEAHASMGSSQAAVPMRRWLWVDTHYACGAVVVDEQERVVDAAPIYRARVMGRTLAQVKFLHSGWRFVELPQ